MTKTEGLARKIRDLHKVKTCVGCPYWKTCERTDPKNIDKGFSEVICKLEIDQILRACKESRLMFTEEESGAGTEGVRWEWLSIVGEIEIDE